MTNPAFWRALDGLIAASEIVIDRPKGSVHPRQFDACGGALWRIPAFGGRWTN